MLWKAIHRITLTAKWPPCSAMHWRSKPRWIAVKNGHFCTELHIFWIVLLSVLSTTPVKHLAFHSTEMRCNAAFLSLLESNSMPGIASARGARVGAGKSGNSCQDSGFHGCWTLRRCIGPKRIIVVRQLITLMILVRGRNDDRFH